MQLAITTQAEAIFYEKDTLTFNAGVIENELGTKENIYGISIFQAKGKNKFGWAGGIDYMKYSVEVDLPYPFKGSLSAKEHLIAPNIGFSYGITNELYVVPTIGFGMANAQATYEYQEENDEGELEDKSQNIEESAYGANIGVDLMYKTNYGLVFGVGGRYSRIDGMTLSQAQLKIGFSFK